MSEEQLRAFMEAVKAEAGLQEKLNAAADADAVVAIAKAAGFVISAEELQRAQAEISEEDLEGVAGGIIVPPPCRIGTKCLPYRPITQNHTSIQSPCHHRGFSFLQSSPKRLKRPPIPGTIAHLHRQS